MLAFFSLTLSPEISKDDDDLPLRFLSNNLINLLYSGEEEESMASRSMCNQTPTI